MSSKTKFDNDSGALVSILMNCYNGMVYLEEAISSVIRQTYPNWELIFWDNQSTDKSPTICKSFSDPRIRYFRSDRHTNLGMARLLALEQARGEFIAVLDTDDLWLPCKLELQIPLFRDPDVGIVISDTIFFNNNGKERQLYRSSPPPQGYVFHQLVARYFVSLETVILRKKSIDGLDQSFDPKFHHISDFDLIVRLGRKWKLAYVPKVLAKWRVHSNSTTYANPDGFNSEKQKFIEKMDGICQSFNLEWKMSRESLLESIGLSNAAVAILRGDKKAGRVELGRFFLTNRRAMILYIISFMPFSERVIGLYLKSRRVSP